MIRLDRVSKWFPPDVHAMSELTLEVRNGEYLVLVGPSPCYLNQQGYTGGFERKDLEELLDFMDSNFLGWAGALAPQITKPLLKELTALVPPEWFGERGGAAYVDHLLQRAPLVPEVIRL